MNKFNLTFNGEILSGQTLGDVKLRFAKAFQIDDQERLERFFSGQTITLRRNLGRKAAAQCFTQMREIGIVAELVKIGPEQLELDKAARKLREEEAARKAAEADRLAEEEAQRLIKEQQWKRQQAEAEKAALERAEQAAERKRLQAERDLELAEQAKKRAELERRKAQERERHRLQQERKNAEREAARAEQARLKAEQQAQEKARKAEEKRKIAQEKARKKEEAAAAALAAAERKSQYKAEKARKQAELVEQRAEEERAEEERAEEARAQQEAAAAKKAAEQEAQRKAQQAAKNALQEKQRAEEAAARLSKQTAQQKNTRQETKDELAGNESQLHKAEIASKQNHEAHRQRKFNADKEKKARAEDAARDRILREVQLRRQRAEEQEQGSLFEEQAIRRGAEELARGSAVKHIQPKVKTRLDLPKQATTRRSSTSKPAPRRRQSGEPNFYKLRAFRVNDEVRKRPARARAGRRRGVTLVALAIAALAMLPVLRMQWHTPPPVEGVAASAVNSAGHLYLLAGGQLLQHDRSGVGENAIDLTALSIDLSTDLDTDISTTLGIIALRPPIQFAPDDTLFALAHVAAQGLQQEHVKEASPQLVRCDLDKRVCSAFPNPLPATKIHTYLPHPLDGSVFLVDTQNQQLAHISADGDVLGRAHLALPKRPHLALHSGLLLINSAEGPAISIYRYDQGAFGAKLDEVLLLPPSAVKAQHNAIGNFVLAGEYWWVLMYNETNHSAGLYRFDSEWKYLDEATLDDPHAPLDLVTWGDRILVSSERQLLVARYNKQGLSAAPLESTLLKDLAAGRSQVAQTRRLGLAGVLIFSILLVFAGGALIYINNLRLLVYKPKHDRGAQPVDDYVESLSWVPPSPKRPKALQQRGIAAGVLALALCMLCIGLGATVGQLGALLIALSGPFVALLILLRLPTGNIGATEDHLLLVDHEDLYHFGGGSEIQYHGSFLILYDVVVFCGNRFAPAFARPELNAVVTPLALHGVKIDRKTLLVKLVESRHPVFQALAAILIFAGIALAVLLTPLLF